MAKVTVPPSGSIILEKTGKEFWVKIKPFTENGERRFLKEHHHCSGIIKIDGRKLRFQFCLTGSSDLSEHTKVKAEYHSESSDNITLVIECLVADLNREVMESTWFLWGYLKGVGNDKNIPIGIRYTGILDSKQELCARYILLNDDLLPEIEKGGTPSFD